ncbi:Glutathione synthase/RimK-type ligase, ATP-grasp superfamily [Micromonospora viridifaciens]|uniref:Glutathione synthase/RimK-type ligase, ATP-grasp superfamily n=1 Tax=Micromonospora viridifaciens TaxID=1881 RepID=A0A1C4XEE2_MICVI|nr:STM4014 family protein [Micromonospora viridifaciens]SCF06879.1 Glutathione synthase/RimK-type ligase, ATP-grasp superfamily [Micromonospora viridifaciens]
MRLTVVGNPGNRRVDLFRRAVLAAGLPRPEVLPWADVLTGAPPPPAGALVRVDSPGEDPAVDQLLRRSATPARPGELVGLAAAYAGLVAGVGRVAAAGATLLNQPEDVAGLCDKRRCHALLAAAGVPVPDALPAIDGYARLRAAMATAGWRRVFVKPAHGSSAAGVIALTVGPGRVEAVTTVEHTPEALFNSLRLRRYTRESEVAAIVDRLAPDGLHVERWLPKAGLGDRVVDLRVVVVAGRPTHAVVRAARGPLTNLHLGNMRGDLAELRSAAGSAAWSAAMETCERVAACFPGSLHVGVDLMFLVGWRRHAVAEVNAFGDLLPGVLVDGRDTYAEQVYALTSGRWDRWRAGREVAACGA